MKKIYLSILGAVAISSSFAQLQSKRASHEDVKIANVLPTEVTNVSKKPTTNSVEKAAGASLFSSDFTNAGLWNIATTGGTSVAGTGWNINSTKEGLNYFTGSINSTSDGEFAELWNGDSGATNIGAVHTLTTANPISITNNNLVLSFQQYGANFYDTQSFEVSTNGTTWVTVGNNDQLPATTATYVNTYTNSMKMKFSLKNYVASNATQLWVRFKWETTVLTGGAAGFAYGWHIDDVNVSEMADNDLTLASSYATIGLLDYRYSQLPLSQATEVKIGGKVINNGKNSPSDVNLTGTITTPASFSVAGTPAAFPNGIDTLDIVTTSTFNPTVIGTYNYTATTNSGATDDVTSDNSLTGTVKITKNKFAVDNGTAKSSIAGSSFTGNAGKNFKIGNRMEITGADIADFMFVRLDAASTNVGLQFFGEIWRDNGTDFEQVAYTDPITVTAQNNGTEIKLPLIQDLPVSANDELLVLACQYTANTSIRFATAQPVPDGHVLLFLDGDTKPSRLINAEAIMVGLYLDKDASINENTASISNSNLFPNPTTGKSSVSYSLGTASKVSVKVVDVTGKVVYTSTEESKEAGNHTSTIDASAFNTGVYYVTVSTNDTQLTQKLIKK